MGLKYSGGKIHWGEPSVPYFLVLESLTALGRASRAARTLERVRGRAWKACGFKRTLDFLFCLAIYVKYVWITWLCILGAYGPLDSRRLDVYCAFW